MRILCMLEDTERQGWALAFQHRGDDFSFFDGRLAIHHVCQLFNPDIFIHNTLPAHKSIQNACNEHNCTMINVHFHKIPICANTFIYKPTQTEKKDYIAVFGDPSPTNEGIINKISQKHKIRIFGGKKWGANEYCGFVNPAEYSKICNEAAACIVVSGKPSIEHYHVCAAGGSLLHGIEGLEIGTHFSNINEIEEIINSKQFYLQRLIDRSFVLQNRNCNLIPDIIYDIYQKENRHNPRYGRQLQSVL